MVTFEISDFGAYIDTDLLENLRQEQYGAEEVLSDMIPYVQELSRDKDGNIKGLTWQSTPGGFWYRRIWQESTWEQMIRRNSTA